MVDDSVQSLLKLEFYGQGISLANIAKCYQPEAIVALDKYNRVLIGMEGFVTAPP